MNPSYKIIGLKIKDGKLSRYSINMPKNSVCSLIVNDDICDDKDYINSKFIEMEELYGEFSLENISVSKTLSFDKTPTPGSVVILSDSDGVHTGLVLVVEGIMAKMVMCTSNPYWNPLAREATKDELALLSMPVKYKTYLAPVYRPVNCLNSPRKLFSKERVQDLIDEFDWMEAKYY